MVNYSLIKKSAPYGADSFKEILFCVALRAFGEAYAHRRLRKASFSVAVLFRVALFDNLLCDVRWNLFITVDFHG